MKMTYEEAMEYISNVGMFGSNYGLERTHRLLELLGSPQNKLKLIHIAGTNGKGSTTSMISKVLIGMGFKVGMYTSPYLEVFEERIQINGVNIPKDKLIDNLENVKYAVSKVIEEGYEHPTEFEIITALMFLYFYNEKIDYGVIEVGLGGRLDSTNVIIPKVSVITSISMDHINILGNTIEEIAKEKSGIIKEDVPVILYPQKKEAEDVILKAAHNNDSKVYYVKTDDGNLKGIDYDNITQNVQVNGLNGIYNVDLPLLGEHQILNLCVAIKVVEVLCQVEKIQYNKEIIEESLKDVKWIGRLETLNRNPLIVIDGAHNIDGIRVLKNNIRKYFKYNKMYLLLGILADKQVDEMIKEITPMAEKIFALTPHSDRAELSEDLKREIEKVNQNVEAFDDYNEAINEALKVAEDDDLILVSGSLYMIGDMRKIINKIIN
ncbi:bifunctional folylpolyglutamate synthase/dihydrofolate synthase [Clostridium butyricum]|uniref:bifunctional folylpolyglutamate synthase/dihydrofolate synthase n=1 Tax=Clostridium butyricum TaxID=1492 RepID=UPI00071B5618|nr:folylpolyglutamate synthase/dihydrofolate synthase family protein [Clostridium butyricum]ALP90109.1 bifunctional folylpolyglutamate synthase/dihydrofolate synthase [Clostridium butyricum]ALS16563.1 bifunctional folylpolyglutamate synthase/dihydrofolate synthase [Clostridium butyricum]ANF13727.1 bifunctional folylpolyglutamate synthase/dihydrofolate synthase [Clostridium butyricum]AOR93794.1 bifunctional folylpolyglutamate synthase/dihydrofolate synthase [Clostridium butyricum]MCI3007899.1 b